MGYFFAAGTPNPAAVRRVRPVLPSTLVMNARAPALFELAETTQMPYAHGRLSPARAA